MKTLYIPVTYGPYPYSAAKKAFRMRPEAAQEVKKEEKAKGPYFESETDAIEWAEQNAEKLNKAHELNNPLA